MFSSDEYREAISALLLGMSQLQPDGNCCAICGDTGHQAWECHHNPLSLNYIGRQHWRCYHCDLIFTDPEAAEDHFGPRDIKSHPICVDKAGAGR